VEGLMSVVEPAAKKINENTFSLRHGPVRLLACCAARQVGTATTKLLPTYYGTDVTAVQQLLRWIIW
jgi:hypothetical protein